MSKVLFCDEKLNKIHKRKAEVRGPYKKYSVVQRKEAVHLAEKLSPMEASRICNIPIKNLKRWIANGYYRKKGGRKTQDPRMEDSLIRWIDQFYELNQKLPDQRLIKDMALMKSNFGSSFKASKGWYEKFLNRYKKGKNIKFEESSIKPTKSVSEVDDGIFKLDEIAEIYLPSEDGNPVSSVGDSMGN